MEEACKIEKITNDSLELLVACHMNQANEKIKVIKDEKYQLHVKAHHTRKEIEIDKLEIKHLKKNLEKVRNNSTNINQEISMLTKQIQTLKETEESLRLKEKEWEFNVKEVDKLKHEVKNLEHTLNLKGTHIGTLEKKFHVYRNVEIESIFERKVGNGMNRKKRMQFQRLINEMCCTNDKR